MSFNIFISYMCFKRKCYFYKIKMRVFMSKIGFFWKVKFIISYFFLCLLIYNLIYIYIYIFFLVCFKDGAVEFVVCCKLGGLEFELIFGIGLEEPSLVET